MDNVKSVKKLIYKMDPNVKTQRNYFFGVSFFSSLTKFELVPVPTISEMLIFPAALKSTKAFAMGRMSANG